MHSQRYWLADAHGQGFSPQQAAFIDPPALTQLGWSLFADFGRGQLYDQARGLALTTSAAGAWGTTPSGGAFNFAAAATNCSVNFPSFPTPVPTRYTIAVLVQIGSIGSLENISTWVENTDANTYDHQIRLTTGGKIEWYAFGGATIQSTTTMVAGQMVHVVATYDGATHRLFINGRQENSAASASSGYTGYGTVVVRLGYKAGHGSFASATTKILSYGQANVAYDPGQIADLWQRPFGQTTPRRKVRAQATQAYTLSADGIARAYSFGAATLTRGYALSADGVARVYSFGAAGLSYQPAHVGDTHDGFVRRSRRERALEAAARRERDEWVANRNALRLSLEAAMGLAAEVVEDAPPAAVEAVEAAQEAVAVVAPVLARRVVDVAALAEAQALVDRLYAAVEEAARLKALADDDEEVLMLLRAL